MGSLYASVVHLAYGFLISAVVPLQCCMAIHITTGDSGVTVTIMRHAFKARWKRGYCNYRMKPDWSVALRLSQPAASEAGPG